MALAALLAGCGTAGPGFHSPVAPYAATPEAVGLEMLRLAAVTGRDTVYDLGSGDGRLVIEAARRFGARAVGVEIDGALVQDSREHAARAGVGDRVTFLWRTLFEVDLHGASVVTLYLLPEVNLRLRPRLLAQLAPGARVVSHDFDMGDWPPDRVLRVRGPDREHRLLLWIVPAQVDGAWDLTVETPDGARRYRAIFRQRFQRFAGSLAGGDGERPVTDGTLRGDEIAFQALGARFTGRVVGGEARGTYRLPGEGAPAPSWTARRAGTR